MRKKRNEVLTCNSNSNSNSNNYKRLDYTAYSNNVLKEKDIYSNINTYLLIALIVAIIIIFYLLFTKMKE